MAKKKIRCKEYLILLVIVFLSIHKGYAQDIQVVVGTDIPYQHYTGVNVAWTNVDISFRTGILTAPYSDLILDVVEAFGTDEVYIDLLEPAFEFGWMNTVGVHYKFGRRKNWNIGAEIRIDNFTASDAREDLIETVTGQNIMRPNLGNRNPELSLGLNAFALGLRFGRRFHIDSEGDHAIKAELSIYKYVATNTVLEGNVSNLNRLNTALDNLIWEDVFQPYGYIGGVGLAYVYIF